MGFTDDLRGVYARASIIAFPSRLEGFPLALLEAAGYSLPAVAQADLPGVADIVTSDTGVVTDGTVAAYAAGLRRLMADPELRARLGNAARARAESRYSRKAVLDGWEALLRDVAATPGRSSRGEGKDA